MLIHELIPEYVLADEDITSTPLSFHDIHPSILIVDKLLHS